VVLFGVNGDILDFNRILSQKRLANAEIPYYNTGLKIYDIL
jgi:hypothetical protein